MVAEVLRIWTPALLKSLVMVNYGRSFEKRLGKLAEKRERAWREKPGG